LDTALRQQQRSGERLGRVLLTLGHVRRLDLGMALAERWGRPFLKVEPSVVDPAAAQRFPLEATLRLRAVPLHLADNRVVVATAEEPGAELLDTIAVVYPGREIDLRVTTDWDIDMAIAMAHRRKLVDTSIYGLYFRDQSESAFTVFTLPQYQVFGGALLALLGGLWAAPLFTLLLLNVPIT
jgi:hypothetical protein